ncbi:hypothetical protein AB0F83_17610, partial [Micromonospora chalcea]|uniref:hypothetical protein n=1 Tax=Micromonospora chalcea TaxID=1874 RepID=UPI003408C2B8
MTADGAGATAEEAGVARCAEDAAGSSGETPLEVPGTAPGEPWTSARAAVPGEPSAAVPGELS